jgi:CRP/FNR family transcriptional regulator
MNLLRFEPRPNERVDLTKVSSPCRRCDIVREVAFCAGLTPDEVQHVGSIRSSGRSEPEQTVFREGDPADYVYSVSVGTVKLYKLLPDGRRQVIGFLFNGDLFGLADERGYAYSAESVTVTHLCRFSRRKLENLFEEFPRLEKRVYSLTLKELAAAHEQMLLLGRKTAREKLASFLLYLGRRLSRDGELGEKITLPMGRSDIADYLGLTIETVSRTFTQLKKSGIIGLPESSSVIFNDIEALQHIAAGEKES